MDKFKRLNLNCPEEFHDRLKAIAENEYGRSLSELVRTVLEDFMNKEPRPPLTMKPLAGNKKGRRK